MWIIWTIITIDFITCQRRSMKCNEGTPNPDGLLNLGTVEINRGTFVIIHYEQKAGVCPGSQFQPMKNRIEKNGLH